MKPCAELLESAAELYEFNLGLLALSTALGI